MRLLVVAVVAALSSSGTDGFAAGPTCPSCYLRRSGSCSTSSSSSVRPAAVAASERQKQQHPEGLRFGGGTGGVSRRSRSRLQVGKIFGDQEEEVEEVDPDDDLDDLDDIFDELGEEDDTPATGEEKKAEFFDKFIKDNPKIRTVKVDQYGDHIGGYNPWIEQGLEPPPKTDPNEWPEVVGPEGNAADGPDAPWRLKAEDIIRREVEQCDLNCYDIMWSFHKLEVTVTRGGLDPSDAEAGYVESSNLMSAIRAVNAALEEVDDELGILKRFELIIATPGSKDILTTAREFVAFKGFDVIVTAGGPFKNKRKLEGRLLERTLDELVITQDGRQVRMPLGLVDEVRLPPPTYEPGDREILEDVDPSLE